MIAQNSQTHKPPFPIGTWTERETGRARAVVDSKDGAHVHLVDLLGSECTCGGHGDCEHWAAVQSLGAHLQQRDVFTFNGWKCCPGCGQMTLAILPGQRTSVHACESCGWGRAVYTMFIPTADTRIWPLGRDGEEVLVREVVDPSATDVRNKYRIYRVRGESCTCGAPDCEHMAAVARAWLAPLADLQRRPGVGNCPTCGAPLRYLTKPQSLIVCCRAGCGFGFERFQETARRNGNGHPGRRARTATRYVRSWR